MIERAHQAAVKDALAFIEKHALFTRTGPQGIRQVNVRGLVAAAFTHRDSRAGDPDLHTHVAVANKVQTLDGRWLSIDDRVLFKANVAASKTYNTALEQHLRETLGVRFAERPWHRRYQGLEDLGQEQASRHHSHAGRHPGGDHPRHHRIESESRSRGDRIKITRRPDQAPLPRT